MLQQLSLKNFKSLENLQIEPRLITVLIGANGTGKSTVLHALAVLKQSVDHNALLTSGPLIALGQYSDIVSMHDTRRDIRFSLAGTVSLPDAPEAMLLADSLARYQYDIICASNGVTLNAAAIQLDHLNLKAQWTQRSTEQRSQVSIPNLPFKLAVILIPNSAIGQPFRFSVPRPSDLPDQLLPVFENVQRTLATIEAHFRSFLGSIFVIPAFRGFDTLTLPLTSELSKDLMSKEGVTQQGARLASVLLFLREAETKVSNWLERVTGNRIIVRFAGGTNAVVDSARSYLTVNMLNEGTGANQLVFPLAQIAISPRGALVGIEEPEIHLHPRAQAALSDVLVDVAKDDGKQIILTTHSEHLLLRLLTNITEGRLRPEELAVYAFEKSDTVAVARQLEINEKGQVRGGLPGFFEADLAQLDQYISALERT